MEVRVNCGIGTTVKRYCYQLSGGSYSVLLIKYINSGQFLLLDQMFEIAL